MTELYDKSSQMRVRMAILESQVKAANNRVSCLKLSNKKLESAIKSLTKP